MFRLGLALTALVGAATGRLDSAPHHALIADGDAGHALAQWQEFVQQSYNTVYRPLRALCAGVDSEGKEHTATQCYERMFQETREGVEYPWWVRTLLRDATTASKSLLGPWHMMSSRNPLPTAMCAIEKVGTEEWRKFMCMLNRAPEHRSSCSVGCEDCFSEMEVAARALGLDLGPAQAPTPSEELLHAMHGRSDAATFAVVRDPLERFVSGYIDKCEEQTVEGHCEPLRLYMNGTNSSGTLHEVASERMQVGAYVSTFPLEWNMHFFPQALYCDDLGRSWRQYSMVGTMNETLKSQVIALGKHLDARAAAQEGAAATEHGLAEGAGASAAAAFPQSETTGHETGAGARVAELLSARAARQLLEYYAIDYVELGLPLPGWLASVPFV